MTLLKTSLTMSGGETKEKKNMDQTLAVICASQTSGESQMLTHRSLQGTTTGTGVRWNHARECQCEVISSLYFKDLLKTYLGENTVDYFNSVFYQTCINKNVMVQNEKWIWAHHFTLLMFVYYDKYSLGWSPISDIVPSLECVWNLWFASS